MITVSSLTKFWAFALAEQLDKRNLLSFFHTGFAGQKHPMISNFVSRLDTEEIRPRKMRTHLFLAVGAKKFPSNKIWLNQFDLSVSRLLKKDPSSIYVGWSGSCLNSLRMAKSLGKLTIVERGSSHILFQDRILREEYKRYNKNFNITDETICKEILEYECADYISVPSRFVFDSFVSNGIAPGKILINPYGVSNRFSPMPRKDKKFRILYLGSLSIRKGAFYLLEALRKLNIPNENFEVWFVGNIDIDVIPLVEKFQNSNWHFFGYQSHKDLADLISQCDVKVHPSVEEGLSMVIPQVLSCGVPVIATVNTGGSMVVNDNINGFIIPIRSSDLISDRINYLYANPKELHRIKSNALLTRAPSWDDYGSNYIDNLKFALDKL